jgi:hypothetical protein
MGASVGGSRVYDGREKKEPFAGYPGRIVERELESAATSEWAQSFLPPPFVSAIDFDAGSWSALLPDGIPQDRANQLAIGILPEPPVDRWKPFDPDEWSPEWADRIASSFGCTPEDLVEVPKPSLVLFAANLVVGYLSTSASAVALVLDMDPDPNCDAPGWTTAMGLFYPVVQGERDRDSVADLMDYASSVQGELVLLTTAGGLDSSEAFSVTDEQLVELVGQASGLILGAYDGEGYVIWRRR